MIASNFEYFAPKNIDKALELLGKYGDDCKVLAGGHSLLPAMKLRLAAPAVLVDIGKIKKLDYIKIADGVIAIGAMTTHAAIAASAKLKKQCPLLVETAAQIGDLQVRNRGTIGGSLVHADPAADWPAAILALNADIVVRNKDGERTVKATEFFTDLLTTVVQTGELVTEIRIPAPANPQACAYLKVPQAASGFAIVGVAVQLELDGANCKTAAVGVTGLAARPYRAAKTEATLTQGATDAASITAAAGMADAEASDIMEDIHASGDYRRSLARTYAKRAVEAAMKKG
ncbi:MAG: FAD binding domain-containing protein [Blastocatellia bacterium]